MLRKILVSILYVLLAIGYGQVLSGARAVPKLLNYQGYLTDTLGSPIDDSLDMTLKIYNAATLGSVLWSETQTNVPIERGVFSVLLGDVTPIPDSVFTEGTDRWLELTLEGPQTLSPRTRITSVGYAYTSTYSDTAEYARNAVADNDWSLTDSVLFTGNYWGIARGGANNALHGNIHTHINLGVACTTGVDGEPRMYCTVGGGWRNKSRQSYATVGGGYFNTAGDFSATVAGGQLNTASEYYAVVGGGRLNTASGYDATVAGGRENHASGNYATVAGGYWNNASNEGSTVTGGFADTVNSFYGGILSGYSNMAGDEATDTAVILVGGWNNSALGNYSFIGGGKDNYADDEYAVVAAGHADTVKSYYGGILSGYSNMAGRAADTAVIVVGGWNNTAYGNYSFIGGGKDNFAGFGYYDYEYAVVAAGYADTVKSFYGGILSGYSNMAGEGADTAVIVVGGWNNSALGNYSFIGGGKDNYADYEYAVVAAGYADTVKSFYGGILSGYSNMAGGEVIDTAVIVVGGWNNSALRRYSFIGGGKVNYAGYEYAVVAAGHADTVESFCGGILSGYSNMAGDEATDTAIIVVGGWNNSATAKYSFVGGGKDNAVSGNFSTIAGGWENVATGSYATVSGGDRNTASGNRSTVGGGVFSTASDAYATVCGGISHDASAIGATVGGGWADTSAASYSFTVGNSSMVPAGYDNSSAFNGQTATASGQTRVGVLSKASGTFTIDHPLDPENKILNHYFVESPEMVLMYRGSVVLDADGRAEVHLPDYFDALNKNPMIQVSGVGTPDVYIVEEVTGNVFVLGGKPNAKVYWTVTSERKDQAAEITKIIMPVEQPKEGGLANRSLDDEFLATTMLQLERMGKANGFSFRYVSEQQRYEQMKRMELDK